MVTLEEGSGYILWNFLSGSLCFLFGFLIYPDIYGLILFGFSGLVAFNLILVIADKQLGWYDDITDNSSDWDDMDFSSSKDITNSFNWTLIGLAFLFVVSVAFGFVINGNFSVAFWVPKNIIPLSAIGGSAVFGFVLNLAITWFGTVPGEESFKNCVMTINKAFPQWDLPFAFQPGRITANVLWAVMHIVLGQNPPAFFFSVFIGGCIMDVVAAQAGTNLANYYIHALFNTIVLVVPVVVSFISSGAITLVW